MEAAGTEARPGRSAKSAEEAWVAETLALTLRSLSLLCAAAAESPTRAALRAVRDLADHAELWSEIGDGKPERACAMRVRPQRAVLETSALLTRLLAGLGGRLRHPGVPLGPEARRMALACAADFDRRARPAEGLLRNAERAGGARDVQRMRERLPSLREFASPLRPDRRVPERDATGDAPRDAPCRGKGRRASSAA
ncbi:MAG: hypothetical protein RRA92_03155 [Gemmatimonadota bacterium]|nr:hypothetical protein [Gemmatimonadota bacterium]